MALIKNEIPILEYDTEARAVLMPSVASSSIFTEKAVMLFMKQEVEDYVKAHDCEVLDEFVCVSDTVYIYKTKYQGQEITFVQALVGGAAAVEIMEYLIAGGAKKIIAAGCCGALEDDVEGDFFIPTTALRQEGVSYQYLPPSREVELSEEAVAAIERALIKEGLSYRKCKTWTTDCLFRETKEMVLYRKSEGCTVVEMECASLAACAKMRGVVFGQLLFSADSLADVEKHNKRNWGENAFLAAMELAINAALLV